MVETTAGTGQVRSGWGSAPSRTAEGHVYLLREELVVLRLELLQDVLVVEQFLDRAVALAEQVLNRGAAVLAVVLPEVAVEESSRSRKTR